ncbi:MAG: hypothetical protein WB973_19280 [Thermoanaerobaculia bacterium]
MPILRRHKSNCEVFEAQMHRWIALGMGDDRDFMRLMPLVRGTKRFLLIPRYSYAEHFASLIKSINVNAQKGVDLFEDNLIRDTAKCGRAYVALDFDDGKLGIDRSARAICKELTRKERLPSSAFEGLAHLLLVPQAAPPASLWVLGGSYCGTRDYKAAVLSEPGRIVFADIDGAISYRDTAVASCSRRLSM